MNFSNTPGNHTCNITKIWRHCKPPYIYYQKHLKKRNASLELHQPVEMFLIPRYIHHHFLATHLFHNLVIHKNPGFRVHVTYPYHTTSHIPLSRYLLYIYYFFFLIPCGNVHKHPKCPGNTPHHHCSYPVHTPVNNHHLSTTNSLITT